MLHIRHRGFGTCEGLREGLVSTLACKLCLRRKGFCDICEGFEGLARAYSCERGGRRHGTLAYLPQRNSKIDSGVTRRKPSIPSRFLLNRLNRKRKNPRILYLQPSLNPRNPRNRMDL